MDERLDQAIALIRHTSAEMRSLSSPADIAAATSDLQAKLDGLLKESTNQTKELHSGINKLNKVRTRCCRDPLSWQEKRHWHDLCSFVNSRFRAKFATPKYKRNVLADVHHETSPFTVPRLPWMLAA
eukprot:793300-Pelagomonas_calceolata.AAC.1